MANKLRPSNIRLAKSSIKPFPDFSVWNDPILDPMPKSLGLAPSKLKAPWVKKIIKHARKHWWVWGNVDSDAEDDVGDIEPEDIDTYVKLREG
jgi:hypothetical protein